MSLKGMLWAVRHGWPRIARFAFNCYLRKIRLVVCVPGQVVMILMSREGVAQGDPLVMVLYCMAMLSLIKHPRAAYPDVL